MRVKPVFSPFIEQPIPKSPSKVFEQATLVEFKRKSITGKQVSSSSRRPLEQQVSFKKRITAKPSSN
jgi:hypothetical protein